MSIVSVSKCWLNHFYKILAMLLVLLAVLISAFRLFLPYVENYRQDFQDYINNSNQTSIVIGALGMNWQSSGPTLIANQVTLVDTHDAYVYIDHLEIQIDFWATLTAQRLISSNLVFDGVVATLRQGLWHALDNKPAKNSVAASNSNLQVDSFQQISTIFLNRINRFSLINSEISIENNSLKRHFRINNLNWLNKGKRHQAQGNIIVDELSSNNLTLKIDVKGQYVDELKGLIYIEANHLDITPWLDSVLAIANNKTKADIGFSAWFNVKKGIVDRLQIALHDNLISWEENTQINTQENTQENTKSSKLKHSLTLSSGQLLLVKGKTPTSFTLYSTPLLLQFDQQEVATTIVQLSHTAEDFSLYLSSFNLALISQVSPLFIHSKSTRELLSNLEVNGQANDLYLKKGVEGFQALANFENISTKYSQGVPGIDNLSGDLSLAKQTLHINLAAEQGALDFNDHFVAPIPYQSLAARVDLFFTDNGWKLQANNIALNSNELNLSGDLVIDANKDKPMLMSLFANITEGDVSKTGHYLPLTIMSHDLVDYLNGALIDGKIKQAQVLVNGPVANFPFADNSGVFLVNAELEDATFKFSQDWPAIKEFSANLNFTNESLLITGRAGELTGLDVSGVQVAIDNLGNESILTVDSFIKASPATYIAKLMQQSPFKNSVGSVLQQLQVSGDIKGEFHLNLPLNNTKEVVVSGLINLANNKIALQAPRMDFEQVNGTLIFENENISTKNLSLNWRGLPLKLTLKGDDKSDYYDTHITLNADWKKKDWQPHVAPDLQKYLDGQLLWQGDLSLYQHHDGGFTYQFIIDSNLAQMTFALPEPYNKPAQINTPLKIELNGQLDQSTLTATYGDQLSFFGVLSHDTSHFSRAHIMLGDEVLGDKVLGDKVLGDDKMLLPRDGFHITTNLEQVNAQVWQPFIFDIINAVSKEPDYLQNVDDLVEKSPLSFPKPEIIRGTIAKLDLLGQRLNNVSFNLLDKTHWWLLQLNAKETRSEIKLYPDWFEQGIEINADFIQLTNSKQLALNKKENSPEFLVNEVETFSLAEETIFAKIPKITFHCDRCQIDNVNLGELSFSLRHTDENTIKIDSFKAKREQAEFNLSGEWQKQGTISTTSLKGSLSLKSIEYELEQLDYGSIIRDSGGKINFDLNWQNDPYHFTFSQLNGELNVKIDDGYLADYSDKARIFSILSLQSIVRKLTLDFRDIFSDGIFYNDIKGDYHIKEGVLYTSNTRMNGSAGDLFIKGNTSFVDNTLDYKMSYKPNLTSSLPVLAWIATLNPVVFLAGIAIDQVITSKVVSEFNFELTGDINEPIFKEVNRKSRNVSVGRSKPPEFVNTSESNNSLQQKSQDKKSFKEFKSSNSSEINRDQNLFEENKQLEELNDG